jgi:hypothetical protein
MPQITGRTTAPDDGKTIADNLRAVGENIYRPIDPVSQQTLIQMHRQAEARAKMIDALQSGDLVEYGRQGILANVPIDDAQGYARQAGLIGPDWKPTRPLFDPTSLLSPQPPAPVATGSNNATTTTPPQFAPQTVASSPWS